ncbi:MAG: DUF4278 domain-containing protein [Cyanobacteria bacterium J06581_3]
MKLTYRNAQYQSKNIGQVTTPTGETGIYRGAKVQFRAPSQMPVQTGSDVLTYRNAQYHSPRYNSSSQATVAAAPNSRPKSNRTPALVVQ